jgi:maltose alpha-D-glucosyltransferase/alpha-amylase
MRLNLGIRRRLAPLLGNDQRRIRLAHSLLLTFIGSPVLYYGDEIGMGDNIWLEDRDGVRTPMQWTGDANAGFSTAPIDDLYESVIDDDVYGYRRVNVKAQQADRDSLYNWLRHALRVRREHPAFSRGTFEWLPITLPAIAAYWRMFEHDCVLVVHNLSDQPQPIELAAQPQSWIDLLSQARLSSHVSLAPYQFLWLQSTKD